MKMTTKIVCICKILVEYLKDCNGDGNKITINSILFPYFKDCSPIHQDKSIVDSLLVFHCFKYCQPSFLPVLGMKMRKRVCWKKSAECGTSREGCGSHLVNFSRGNV